MHSPSSFSCLPENSRARKAASCFYSAALSLRWWFCIQLCTALPHTCPSVNWADPSLSCQNFLAAEAEAEAPCSRLSASVSRAEFRGWNVWSVFTGGLLVAEARLLARGFGSYWVDNIGRWSLRPRPGLNSMRNKLKVKLGKEGLRACFRLLSILKFPINSQCKSSPLVSTNFNFGATTHMRGVVRRTWQITIQWSAQPF